MKDSGALSYWGAHKSMAAEVLRGIGYSKEWRSPTVKNKGRGGEPLSAAGRVGAEKGGGGGNGIDRILQRRASGSVKNKI